MERYPNNGRLVKIYGRFLEFVCNDPWAAARQYQEAMRLGLADNMLGMASGGSSDDDAATARLTGLAGAIDEKEDCLIIINADGIILMINRVCWGTNSMSARSDALQTNYPLLQYFPAEAFLQQQCMLKRSFSNDAPGV